MKSYSSILLLTFLSVFCFIPCDYSFSGGFPSGLIIETDSTENRLFAFYDQRNRESFLQITNNSDSNTIVHVQIFNVDQNCNENNFFDIYTPNDTHVYNMRDIQTNDGNSSGIDLPDNSYGFVAFSVVDSIGGEINILTNELLGSLRVLDENGYEYRTNIAAIATFTGSNFPGITYTFNFNKDQGITFSEIIGLTFRGDPQFPVVEFVADNFASNQYLLFDINIVNENEDLFSCRNVIFACIDEDNPRQEELLSLVGNSSIARFEYGVNEALPHTKGGEVLCPGNNIEKGIVTLSTIEQPVELGVPSASFIGYAAFNNGNKRGTIDSFWIFNNNITN